MDIEIVARDIVDSAIKVHRFLGPGLFESAYQQCLVHELRQRCRKVECELVLPIYYDGMKIESAYRIDMLVEEAVLVENKSVEQILPVHESQILTYLRLSGYPLGFLINWKVSLIKNGIKRYIFSVEKSSRSTQHIRK